MDKVAGSGNDEYYTPFYAVKPIFKYIEKAVIWCPFDTEDSYFVKYARSLGHEVIATHIKDGKDFFKLKPKRHVDYIISNPPYSLKTEVLERLFELNIPFAMLLGVVGIFESDKRFNMFKDHEFEMMYFNRRIAYLTDYKAEKCAASPPYSSVYLCSRILPKQIVFEEVDKKEIHMK